MVEKTIQIPDGLEVKKLSDEIVYRAFFIALEQKRKELRRDPKRVDAKIKRFEKKYQSNLESFEKTMSDGFQEHNDWMDWSFEEEKRNLLIEEMKYLESPFNV